MSVSNIKHKTRFWNNQDQVRSKPNNLNVFWSKKTKAPKQDTVTYAWGRNSFICKSNF